MVLSAVTLYGSYDGSGLRSKLTNMAQSKDSTQSTRTRLNWGRQVHASGWGSNDAVGNSSGVHRELTEGIGSLPGWRKGVCQKKTETHRKIVGVAEKLAGSRDGLVMDVLAIMIIFN
ncbi:hypothetical protein B296_00011575 [Ensete ventricosum]|uniref:Uncharacterized protein n=1 Tax=Ensete ventricosum TaxID=4639 RepID=A0A426Y7A2_ENSVE|nr:hypothetical protein B296_00011575 [Ensete ventricosum]